MTELVLTRGLPASGKSTYARAWVNEDPRHRTRLNRDDLRKSTYGVYHGLDYSQEQTITLIQHSAAEALLRDGVSVIVDDTNLRLKHARAWADLAVTVGAEFSVVDMQTSVEDCLRWADHRRLTGGRLVGEEVIRNFAQRYRMPWPEVKPTERKAAEQPAAYVPDESKPKAWLVDIDGTVAKKRMGPGERDWHEYHRVGEDLPNPAVIDLVWALEAADYKIVFMSGRKDSCRMQTRAWLRMHLGTWNPPLFMRATEDNRSDFIVKGELFDEHVRHQYNVVGALDDRDQVVALWRGMGIPTMQVDYGNF